MAVSNKLGMYLPTRDDYISVKRDISDNLAILDAAAGNMDIIVNGNTASDNVTSGQFVTVLNSTITGVTDGIYKAVANVAAGVPFVAANLSAPTSGALNELVEQMVRFPNYAGQSNIGSRNFNAPYDGYVFATLRCTATRLAVVTINGSAQRTLIEPVGSGSTWSTHTPLYPVKKGDAVTIEYQVVGSAGTEYETYEGFIPMR